MILQLRGPESVGGERDGVRALLRQGLRVAVRAALPGQRNRIIKSDLATFSTTQKSLPNLTTKLQNEPYIENVIQNFDETCSVTSLSPLLYG